MGGSEPGSLILEPFPEPIVPRSMEGLLPKKWIEEDCSSLSALELGAGTGLFTRHLALRAFKSFRATDVSGSMIAEGELRLPKVNWESLMLGNARIRSKSIGFTPAAFYNGLNSL